MTPTEGCYLLPEDAITDQLDVHVHRLEGVAFGCEQLLDRETGEVTDFWHTVRVAQGHLAFSLLAAGRVGTVLPASPSTIDGVLKLAGKELTAKGRHVERRVAVVVHVLVGVARNLPDIDVPSIFDPLPGAAEHPEDDAGWDLQGKLYGLAKLINGSTLRQTQGQMMLRRLDTVDAADHALGNEVRRAARARDLPQLVDGVELTLAQTVAYDEVLRRWERRKPAAT